MSKKTENPPVKARKPATTAPTVLGKPRVAAAAEAGAEAPENPTLAARIEALEVRIFGHSPYAAE